MRSEAITARNRTNAQLSTGPRTIGGKAVSRCNAISHGLTANPAAIGAEDAQAFTALLDRLGCELRPLGQLEVALVHRLAVALWRLNRAVVIDAAVSARRLQRVRLPRHEVQRFIEEFHACFIWTEVMERDAAKLQRAIDAGLAVKGQAWSGLKRTRLQGLEALREDMLEAPAGLRAMQTMLLDLWSKYQGVCTEMAADGMHKLAWLHGDHASTIPTVSNETAAGGGRVLKEVGEWPTPVGTRFEVLMRNWPNVTGGVAPLAVSSIVEARLSSFRQQLQVVADEADADDEANRRDAALLPSARVLDRMVRYEVHSERTVIRVLKQLALLRGATVERLAARVTGIGGPGDAVQLSGTRTTWHTR